MEIKLNTRFTRPRARKTPFSKSQTSLMAAAVMSVFAAPAALAAEDVAQELTVITVVGAMPLPGLGQAKNEIPAAVQSASGAAIARSQAIDLTAFMNRNLAGVHINEIQGNPFQPDVSYRGYTASPLLGTAQGLSLYMDGVRLNQPFGDVVSWDLIPRAAIASLTLMPGSNPLFGLNTLGGALSISTKDGLSDPGTAVQALYGADRRRQLELEHGGSNGHGLHWYLTGNVFKEDGWRAASPTDVGQAFGKLGWANARTDLALSLSLADNKLTGNGLQEQRLLARDYRSINTKPDQTDNVATLLNLSGKHRINDAVLFSGNAYYRTIKTSTLNGDINDDALDQDVYQTGEDASNTPFPSSLCIEHVLNIDQPAEKCNGLLNRTRSKQENHGVSGQFSVLGKLGGQRNKFTGGAAYDASRTNFTQSTQLGYLNPDRSITGLNAFGDGISGGDADGAPYDTRVDLTGRSRTWSLFATDTWSIRERWHLTLSGRFNRSKVSNRDHINPGGGGSLDGDHTFERLNPALGLTFTPGRAINAYAGYNEGSRTPTSIELGCADPANPCKLPNAMAGDPPLRQVVTKTWEAGLRGTLAPSLNWNAGVFRADNFDDILFVADNAAGFGYFRNFGKTRRQGLELGISGKAGRLDAGLSYTLLDATYRSGETVGGTGNSSNDAASAGLEGNIEIAPGNRIPLIPRHLFKAHADYRISTAWSVGLAMNAVSASFAGGNENNRHQADGTHYLGSGKSGGYAVFDLNTKYRATPQLSLFAQINNLFDRKYATAAQLGTAGFDASGRFVAQPLPAVGGEFPLLQSTFYSPGAPRTIRVGLRYEFGALAAR